LATSHDCPKVLHHKTALSLAATENISLIEALRLISSFSLHSSASPLSDSRFNFSNFLYLSRQRPSPSSDYNISLSNRFSALSKLFSPNDPSSSFISKPYSLVTKNFTHLHNRPQFDSRSNQTLGFWPLWPKHFGLPLALLNICIPKLIEISYLTRTVVFLLPINYSAFPPFSTSSPGI